MKLRHAARACLAVVLLVGVYVLALALIALIVGGFGAAVVLAVRSDVSVGALLAKLGLVALVTVLAIGRGLWGALRRKPVAPPMGVQLTRDTQPALWAEVDRLAEGVGTRPPDEIWLVGAVNAGVSEDASLLGLRSGVRRMYLGVPLMLAMTRGQLRAVLAHELGHYSGRHTLLGPVTYRGAESLTRVTQELEPRSLVGRVFVAYSKLYFRVSHGVNRRQELEADATSVRITGPATAAHALREVHVADAAWEYFLRNQLGRGQQVGLRPTKIFDAFSAVLADPALQPELEAIRVQDEWPPTNRYDSHPSLPERLRAISAQPDPGHRPDDEPAVGLLRDRQQWLDTVEAWMFEGSKLMPAEWHQVAQATGVQWSTGAAGALMRASEKWNPGEQVTPAEVLEVVRRGHGAMLVEPLLPETADREELHAAARDIVFGYLASALVQQGLARFDVSWDGAWPLVDLASEPVGLLELVDAALKGDAVPLERALHRLGLDLGKPVDADSSAPTPEPRLYGALSHLTSRFAFAHLLTLDAGVLLIRLARKGTFAVGPRIMFTSDSPGKQVQQLVNTGPAVLLAQPGSQLVPWADITAAKAWKRWGEVKLRLTFRDGSTRKLTTSNLTGVAGEPWRVLIAELGDRMDWKV